MPVTINGNGSITGLSVGGLPDGIVDADTLASGLSTQGITCLLYTSPSPRDISGSRMPSSA